MIQRIQSIFLLLATLSLGSLFLDPMNFGDVTVLDGTGEDLKASFFNDYIFDIMDNTILLVLVASGAILALVAIFMFKDRTRQQLVTRLSLVAAILVLILAALLYYKEYAAIPGQDLYRFDVEFGFLSPIFAIIFSALASRFIKKDERLVRSSDRLR